MKLIDKDALVAEIKKKIRTEQGYSSEDAECGYRDCAREILSFLDTLEVKEADLEKEIGFYIETSLTGTNPIYTKGAVSCIIEKTAKHFFELGLKARKEEVK